MLLQFEVAFLYFSAHDVCNKAAGEIITPFRLFLKLEMIEIALKSCCSLYVTMKRFANIITTVDI